MRRLLNKVMGETLTAAMEPSTPSTTEDNLVSELAATEYDKLPHLDSSTSTLERLIN
jgi:hypothetical protein